jgi:hypothetical protein
MGWGEPQAAASGTALLDTDHVTLRSTDWDGAEPHPGDVVQRPDGTVLVVAEVAKGAGVGHWTLRCHPRQLILWRG